jgi:hypothetical protein
MDHQEQHRQKKLKEREQKNRDEKGYEEAQQSSKSDGYPSIPSG